jgi:prepilin-type processing-associated H-X9-DG protein
VLTRSREAAQSLVCKNNLRQIHDAFKRYADDNHQFFPAPLPTKTGAFTPWHMVLAWWVMPKELLGANVLDARGNANNVCTFAGAPIMFCPTLMLADWSNGMGTTYTMAACAKGRDEFTPPENPPFYGPGGYPHWDHVRESSRKIYLMDWQGEGPLNDLGDPRLVAPTWANWNDKPSIPHNGRSNYLFFDGHVEDLPPGDLTPDMWRSED